MQLIDTTIHFVKEKLQNAEGGHDWFHIERVYKNALLIAKDEECNLEIVKLSALLHDIADSISIGIIMECFGLLPTMA